jgi:FkbM family methyltransferase
VALRKQVAKLVAGGPFEWFARDAFYAYVDHIPSPLLPADVVRARNYDRQTIEIAKQALSGDGNSIDAGANAGHILKSLTKLSPMGSHWAFEPIPRFAIRLRQKFPNATVEQLALSDHNGVENFNYLPEDPAYSSLLKRPDLEAGMEVQPLRVAVRRLDDCIPNGVSIAFIKIDVEGAEAAVLRGASQLLRNSRPVIVFECAAMKLSECIPTLEQAGLQISLLADYMNGRKRTTNEVMRIGSERGEFYYVAGPGPADTVA